MNYISAKEAAQKWGISTVRVAVLARGGRIDGAKLLANRWMIPTDAEKPTITTPKKPERKAPTERISVNAENRNRDLGSSAKADDFSRCLFLYSFKENDRDTLSFCTEEEQELERAQRLLNECKFQEARHLLEKILKKTKSPMVKAVALHSLCVALIYFGEIERMKMTLAELKELMQTVFPERRELHLLVYDIEIYSTGVKSYIDRFGISPTDFYSTEWRPFLCVASTYAFSVASIYRPDNSSSPTIYELECQWLEAEGYLIAAEHIHLYLGIYYAVCDLQQEAHYHFRRTLELAQITRSYLCVAQSYHAVSVLIDKELESIPEPYYSEFKGILLDYSEHLEWFINKLGDAAATIWLDPLDYILINRAILGETIKEMSSSLNLSIRTINRRYRQIYQKIKVESKAEMIEKFTKKMVLY